MQDYQKIMWVGCYLEKKIQPALSRVVIRIQKFNSGGILQRKRKSNECTKRPWKV